MPRLNLRHASHTRFGGLFNWLGGHWGSKLVKWPVLRLPN